MTQLIKYEAARAALAEARTLDEVKDIHDKAEAIRAYARMSKDKALEIDAGEIRIRATRRLGEMMAAQPKALGAREPGTDRGTTRVAKKPASLTESGVDKNLAHLARQFAAIPDFDDTLKAWRIHQEQSEERVSLNLRKAPINGARSIMGSRQEPDDSLDYFPTPPWATRALLQTVLPPLGFAGQRFRSVWEPACGEGHMAEVLAEYADTLIATDVHDYGYGAVCDFLEQDDFCDWIITNPPFGEKTEQFVLRALSLANVGVAMFVRLQWLESLGRYENIFRDHAPTLIAFFAERVNLCKGRWEPEGSTATAYIWLLWIAGANPRAPFWIPPGQREALTYPDDAERFTAHPVIRKQHERAAAGPSEGRGPSNEALCREPDIEASSACIAPVPPNNDGLDIPNFLRIGHPECTWRSNEMEPE